MKWLAISLVACACIAGVASMRILAPTVDGWGWLVFIAVIAALSL